MAILKNKVYYIIFVCLLVIGIIIINKVYIFNAEKNDAAVAVLVNGEPVVFEEYLRVLNLRRAFVIDSYSIYGAEYGEEFWDTKYSEETPIEMLKRIALNEAVRIKIQLLLAKEKGIIKNASYSALLEEMDTENSRRNENAINNIPVYGPLKMDENTFIDYYLRNIVIELKNVLSKDELLAGEDELLLYYESVKDSVFALEDTVDFDRISVSYASTGTKAANAELKEIAGAAMETLKLKLISGGDVLTSINETLLEYDGIEIDYSEELLDNESASHYAKYYTGVYEKLKKLGLNIVSDVTDIGMYSEFVLVIVRDRLSGGYIPFEECRDNVEFLYMDEKYDEYINMLIDIAEIEIIESVYEKITSDDVF